MDSTTTTPTSLFKNNKMLSTILPILASTTVAMTLEEFKVKMIV